MTIYPSGKKVLLMFHGRGDSEFGLLSGLEVFHQSREIGSDTKKQIESYDTIYSLRALFPFEDNPRSTLSVPDENPHRRSGAQWFSGGSARPGPLAEQDIYLAAWAIDKFIRKEVLGITCETYATFEGEMQNNENSNNIIHDKSCCDNENDKSCSDNNNKCSGESKFNSKFNENTVMARDSSENDSLTGIISKKGITTTISDKSILISKGMFDSKIPDITFQKWHPNGGKSPGYKHSRFNLTRDDIFFLGFSQGASMSYVMSYFFGYRTIAISGRFMPYFGQNWVSDDSTWKADFKRFQKRILDGDVRFQKRILDGDGEDVNSAFAFQPQSPSSKTDSLILNIHGSNDQITPFALVQKDMEERTSRVFGKRLDSLIHNDGHNIPRDIWIASFQKLHTWSK